MLLALPNEPYIRIIRRIRIQYATSLDHWTTFNPARYVRQSVKFDDLCTNFGDHEDLDAADATVTMTVSSSGVISGMTLSATNKAGVIPITVPSTMVDTVSF